MLVQFDNVCNVYKAYQCFLFIIITYTYIYIYIIYIYVCVYMYILVTYSKVKKSIFGEHLSMILQLVHCHSLSFTFVSNSMICRTYAFPKVQLNLISPSRYYIRVQFFQGVLQLQCTIPRLPLSVNLSLVFEPEDS